MCQATDKPRCETSDAASAATSPYRPKDALEAATIAAFNKDRELGDSQQRWEDDWPPCDVKLRCRKAIRAALYALADADISEEMIEAGWEDDEAAVRFDEDFRSVLTWIASSTSEEEVAS